MLATTSHYMGEGANTSHSGGESAGTSHSSGPGDLLLNQNDLQNRVLFIHVAHVR